MSSNPQRLQYLFQQYLQDTATADELKEFWKLFGELDEEDNPVKNDLWKLWYQSDTENQPVKENWEGTLERIHAEANKWERKNTSVFSRFSRYAAVAIVTLMLGTGAYFLFSGKAVKEVAKTEAPAKPMPVKNDVAAGGNKAILTLSNGATIILNDAPNGDLAQQGNTKILKPGNGQLLYDPPSETFTDNNSETLRYNTLTTPRGGKYEVKLPDGTLVWLNSASSIHYPTAFSVKDRNVEITGEAYFEVAHKVNQPFKVTVNGMMVEVLGTHFNINAYNDEPVMKTTLLEGSIRLSSGSKVQLLTPGQQMQVQPNGQARLFKNVDVEQTIAWKNDLFSFHNTSIYEVMRQISRWYDVDVDFKVPLDVYLNGTIEKKVNVSQVFKMIGLTGEAKFTIDGKKVTVTK